MLEFGFALTIFSLAFVGLALGVLNGRAALKGSCGGLNQIPGLHSDCGGACSRGQVCPNQAEHDEHDERDEHKKTPTRSAD